MTISEVKHAGASIVITGRSEIPPFAGVIGQAPCPPPGQTESASLMLSHLLIQMNHQVHRGRVYVMSASLL